MKRKDYEKMKAEQERIGRRDRWLRELEMRDEEEKAWKERMSKRTPETKESLTEMVEKKTQELKDLRGNK